MHRPWRGVVAALAMLACLLSLLFTPPAEPLAWAAAQSEAHTAPQSAPEPARLAAECSIAEFGCQDVAEREFTLPDAALAATERPYLMPSSLHPWPTQMTLAPPERPPRLPA